MKAQCLCPCQTILLTNPFLGPWHFSYTPFVKPLLLLLLSAHFSLLSLSLSRTTYPEHQYHPPPHHFTIRTCGAVSKATTFDVTSGGIGWMELRGSEAFIRVGHSSLSPPFSCPSHLFSLIYLFAPALNEGHSFPPLWVLVSETLRATLMLCLSCLTGDARTWKCEIEDGPARDVEVKSSRDVCRTVSSVSYYISWFCWPLCGI